MSKRSRYTEEHKADVVEMVRKGDRNFRHVAHALGPNHWTVRAWCELDALKRKKKSHLDVPAARRSSSAPSLANGRDPTDELDEREKLSG